MEDSIFGKTLDRLERNLTVSLVIEPQIWYCQSEEDASIVLTEMHSRGYSQAPVKRNGAVVGVLSAEAELRGTVGETMDPLTSTQLISANASLADIVKLLRPGKLPYRLVVGDEGLIGIVTRADLQKLPVQLLAFTLCTQLESLMTAIIEQVATTESVIETLLCSPMPGLSAASKEILGGMAGNSKAYRKLKERQGQFKSQDIDCSLLEVTDFVHKWYMVMVTLNLTPEFADDMCDIQTKLRNTTMHGRGFARTEASFAEFVRLMILAQDTINDLSLHLTTQQN